MSPAKVTRIVAQVPAHAADGGRRAGGLGRAQARADARLSSISKSVQCRDRQCRNALAAVARDADAALGGDADAAQKARRTLAFAAVRGKLSSFAVWLFNHRRQRPLAHAILKWLLHEAERVGDSETAELQRRNVALGI
jgi:hypothetical protein